MLFHDVSLTADSILLFVAVLGGFVDAIAGGGGTITLPAIMVAGLPPIVALGTNRFQGLVGEFIAALHFMRHGGLNLRVVLPVMAMASVGSAIGCYLVLHTSEETLSKLLPLLLLAVLLYSVISGRLLQSRGKYQMSLAKFAVMLGTLIGFYNGFFGPGTGSLLIASFIMFYGSEVKAAVMYGKPVNFTGNVVAVLIFAPYSGVNWTVGLTMALGQIIGSSIGARTLLQSGVGVIKTVYTIVVLLLVFELILRAFNVT